MHINWKAFSAVLRSTIAGLIVALSAMAGDANAQARDTIGPGDDLRITVFQRPELTTETRVPDNGSISFPLIGEVPVAGMTPEQVGGRIAEKLKSGEYILNPQVGVPIAQLRSRQVSVLGLVNRPGRYPLAETNMKITDVLALAGGLAPLGDDTVTVIREGKPLQVNLPGSLRDGKLPEVFDIRSGDTVFVQRSPVYYIYGEVQRAGAYKLEPGMSVMQALSVGGGVTMRGTDRRMKIRASMTAERCAKSTRSLPTRCTRTTLSTCAKAFSKRHFLSAPPDPVTKIDFNPRMRP